MGFEFGSLWVLVLLVPIWLLPFQPRLTGQNRLAIPHLPACNKDSSCERQRGESDGHRKSKHVAQPRLGDQLSRHGVRNIGRVAAELAVRGDPMNPVDPRDALKHAVRGSSHGLHQRRVRS